MKARPTLPKTGEGWVVIGKFGRPTGLRGHLKLFAYSRDADKLQAYQPWSVRYANNGNIHHLPACEVFELQDKYVRVKLSGVDDRDGAQSLTNAEVLVAADVLPELDKQHYYWHQLIGLTVYNTDQVPFGSISHLIETGANDVLVTEGEDKQRLIPFLMGDVIKEIDLSNKCLVVDWDPSF